MQGSNARIGTFVPAIHRATLIADHSVSYRARKNFWGQYGPVAKQRLAMTAGAHVHAGMRTYLVENKPMDLTWHSPT